MEQKSFDIINLIPILANLPDKDKAIIKDFIIEKEVVRNNVLFIENETVDAIYFLVEGKVRLSKSIPEGKEIVIGIRKKNEFFPKATLFRNSTFPATAVIIEDSKFICIRKKDLEMLIVKYPQIAISLIQLMGERLDEAQNKLRDITLYGKLGSLAATLISLATEHGYKTEAGIKIKLVLTHQELANFIGAARENVNRMMSLLEKDGILTMNRGEILIKDIEVLKDYIA